jgi:anti-sigma B factor antagonist
MTTVQPNLPVESVSDVPGLGGPPPTLNARRFRSGCWLVFEIEGALDVVGAPLLRPLLENDDSSHVVIDLSRVDSIDAAGLGVLAETRERCGRAHGAVRVAGPSQQTRKLLKLTALDKHIEILASLSEAVAGHHSWG